MPCTVPRAVLMLQEPVARMAIRPRYTPAFFDEGGTTARTRSPVRNPPTTLVDLGALSGNPASLVRHIWRLCRPVAPIDKGTTSFQRRCAGVERPTHPASSQWVFGILRCTRFHLVSPPLPVSTGNPTFLKRSYSAHRVAFTAAASLSGAFA